MLLSIDPTSNEPLFAQLEASVRSQIAGGRIQPGERLPAAREVAASLQVNVHTVLRAYAELRDAGLIELRRGRGAVVTANALDRATLHAAVAHAVSTARDLGIGQTELIDAVRRHYTGTTEQEG
ncbi:GntR family transcriptional regulator [Nakamurella silvestris]|nr:GntR family transcriptional regulator [Nakamurella silvestris]